MLPLLGSRAPLEDEEDEGGAPGGETAPPGVEGVGCVGCVGCVMALRRAVIAEATTAKLVRGEEIVSAWQSNEDPRLLIKGERQVAHL